MSGLAVLILAAISFVGTHFLLSHPLRQPLIDRVGTRRFQAIYSLVAIVTFIWMVRAAGQVEPDAPLWIAPEWLWALATALMWFGTILFAGSFRGNPALPGAPAATTPHGVFRITRHPMMWGIGLWGIVHLSIVGRPTVLVIGTAILLLAIAGALGQDRKKRRLLGPDWDSWAAQTSFLPFAWGLSLPGWSAFLVGTALFLLLTFAHQWLGAIPAGPWHWL